MSRQRESDQTPGSLGLSQQDLGLLLQHLPGATQDESASASFEQRSAQTRFKALDLLCQSGLRDVQSFGGATKMTDLSQSQKSPKLGERNVHSSRLSKDKEVFNLQNES